MTRRPCIFFDRDGIVNVPPSAEEYYVLSPERLFIIPAFVEALAVVRKRGWAAVLVTNQKCVGKGLISARELEQIHDVLRDSLRAEGLALDAIYYSPHPADHAWSKPHPGMLLQGAIDLNLDLKRSWMIGDSERDIVAGQAAGCPCNVLVKAGRPESAAEFQLEAMPELPDLLRRELPEC